MVYYIILAVVSFLGGFWLGRRSGPTKSQRETITCSSQQVLLAYLIQDDIYRAKFTKWAKTSSAHYFSELINYRVGGNLYLLQFDDDKQMTALFEQLEPTEGPNV